eukprot:scaffold14396_cov88-Isochrysis_galbana.AAC.3
MRGESGCVEHRVWLHRSCQPGCTASECTYEGGGGSLEQGNTWRGVTRAREGVQRPCAEARGIGDARVGRWVSMAAVAGVSLSACAAGWGAERKERVHPPPQLRAPHYSPAAALPLPPLSQFLTTHQYDGSRTMLRSSPAHLRNASSANPAKSIPGVANRTHGPGSSNFNL